MSVWFPAYSWTPCILYLHQKKESPSIDEEMPIIVAISWVQHREPDRSNTHGPSTRSDLNVLLNTTIEEFFHFSRNRLHLVHILNRYLLQKHGVYVERLTYQTDGSISVEFAQQSRFERRICHRDGVMYLCYEVLQWAFGEQHATLQWSIEFGNRDFSVV